MSRGRVFVGAGLLGAVVVLQACTSLLGLEELPLLSTDGAPSDVTTEGGALDAFDASTDVGGDAAPADSGMVDTSGADVGSSALCSGTGPGISDCAGESCCTSLPVAAGTFKRGNDPGTPATIAAFRLDKYEITVGRFRRFVNAVVGGYRPAPGSGKHTHLHAGQGLATAGGYESGWSDTWNTSLFATKADWDAKAGLACNSFPTWTGGDDRRPINCIDWRQAYAFCIWDGGFLPSEAEWEYAAAGGTLQRKYPWGPEAPGADALRAVYGCHHPTPGGTCTGVGNLQLVGANPADGKGQYGQLGLAGNVAEWVLDLHGTYPASCVDCTSSSGTSRVFRGGNFAFGATLLETGDRRFGVDTMTDDLLGARCARVP
ncbi:MAG: SUMF1/EgtB/PvdO family nonheme iron enzyme [Myxococcales bacterium]|nr:SUMF1/EgtB/PvdO family nonheme iron enzyme [Myxococcales bacterium]